jgi:hypothetical protein
MDNNVGSKVVSRQIWSLTLLLTFAAGCSGAADPVETDQVGETQQAVDPCQQCYTIYNSCVRRANDNYNECMNSCTSPSVCLSGYTSSIRACTNQLNTCTANKC